VSSARKRRQLVLNSTGQARLLAAVNAANIRPSSLESVALIEAPCIARDDVCAADVPALIADAPALKSKELR
jgi:hypothetical protein